MEFDATWEVLTPLSRNYDNVASADGSSLKLASLLAFASLEIRAEIAITNADSAKLLWIPPSTISTDVCKLSSLTWSSIHA